MTVALEHDEYVRRWQSAGRVILWSYAIPAAVASWLSIGAVIIWQPSGRVANLAVFAILSLVIATLGSFGLAVFAYFQAGEAIRWPTIWRNYYRNPWLVGAPRVDA